MTEDPSDDAFEMPWAFIALLMVAVFIAAFADWFFT